MKGCEVMVDITVKERLYEEATILGNTLNILLYRILNDLKNEDDTVAIKMGDLQKIAKTTYAPVLTHLKELCDRGALEKVAGGRGASPNVYKVLPLTSVND